MKKTFKSIMAVVLLCTIISANVFVAVQGEGNKVTLYSNYGSVQVDESEVNAYLNQGWSLTPVKLNNITQLPVTFYETTSYKTYSLDLKQFDIDDLEYLSYSNKIRIHYTMDYDESGYMSLEMVCYDTNGNLAGEVSLSKIGDYIDVPGNTATFKIVASGKVTSGEYYHCRQVDLYSLDRRIITVYDIQTPIYTKVGWYEAVTMYSLDDRTIEIPPYEVENYKKVGWYTVEGYAYHLVSTEVNKYINEKKYNEAIMLVEMFEDIFKGTEYENTVRLLKEKAMDTWRNTSRCPLGYIDFAVGEEYGVSTVSIGLRNISYKKIIAFKLNFTCYDVFGDVKRVCNDYYCSDADINTFDAATYTWKLYGVDDIYSVKNVRITEVVFADGTKW